MQQYDLGLADVPSDGPGVDIEPLMPLEFVCALPNAHRLSNKPFLTAKDIVNEPLLMISPDSHQQPSIMKALLAEKEELNVVFEASNSGPICALVAEGAGLAIIDPLTTRDFRARGVTIRRFVPAVPYELKLIYPANRPRSATSRAFTALIEQSLKSFNVAPD